MWKWIKRGVIGVLLTVSLLALAAYGYVRSLDLDAEPVVDTEVSGTDLGFASIASSERGRILIVVTSTAALANGKRSGYELTEVSRAWWVFVHNGYAVDIASPLGGEPPMVRDDDLIEADHAFLNDPLAQARLRASIALADVDPARYAGVYFAGGKGTMFDFPNNPEIVRILREIVPRGVVGAVCHGPAALLGVTLADGSPLLRGRRVTGFSNAEELFLAADARERLGFLLQDALAAEAGSYLEAPMYLEHSIVDGRLVTGQNPWSTWAVAEGMIRALGHAPVARPLTAEERSVQLLATYHQSGLSAALLAKAEGPRSDKRLLLMHALIAAMRWRIGEAWALQRLARG
jgi:putative intracellular protease/amidase